MPATSQNPWFLITLDSVDLITFFSYTSGFGFSPIICTLTKITYNTTGSYVRLRMESELPHGTYPFLQLINNIQSFGSKTANISFLRVKQEKSCHERLGIFFRSVT